MQVGDVEGDVLGEARVETLYIYFSMIGDESGLRDAVVVVVKGSLVVRVGVQTTEVFLKSAIVGYLANLNLAS